MLIDVENGRAVTKLSERELNHGQAEIWEIAYYDTPVIKKKKRNEKMFKIFSEIVYYRTRYTYATR